MGATRVRLLFTGGGGAGSEPLSRLLSPIHAMFFCDARTPSTPEWIQVPAAHEYGFVEALATLCDWLQIDVLIPGVDEELLRIAMARETFGCHVLMPEAEFIATHLDKLRSMRVLSAAGIPVPTTERISKRLILKPREGRGSRGVQIIGPDLIQQELLQGQEYTVTMVADRARNLRAVVPVRVEEKQGVTVRGVTDDDAEVITACRRIHEAQPTSGLFNIQGMKTKTGFVPFEINPRISTTTCLAIAAGVDVIGLALEEGPAFFRDELAPFQSGLALTRTRAAETWQTEFACAS